MLSTYLSCQLHICEKVPGAIGHTGGGVIFLKGQFGLFSRPHSPPFGSGCRRPLPVSPDGPPPIRHPPPACTCTRLSFCRPAFPSPRRGTGPRPHSLKPLRPRPAFSPIVSQRTPRTGFLLQVGKRQRCQTCFGATLLLFSLMRLWQRSLGFWGNVLQSVNPSGRSSRQLQNYLVQGPGKAPMTPKHAPKQKMRIVKEDRRS